MGASTSRPELGDVDQATRVILHRYLVAAEAEALRRRTSNKYSLIAMPLLAITIGLIWAFVVPSQYSAAAGSLGVRANIFRKIFYVGWSLRFYPQMLLNFQRKTTIGFSIDSAYFNFLGFFIFFLYCILSFNQTIILGQECAEDPKVTIVDVYLSGHAFFASGALLGQMYFFDGYRYATHQGRNSISRKVHLMLSLYIFFNFMYLLMIYFKQTQTPGIVVTVNQWLKSLVYACSFFLVIRYIPQVHRNYHRNQFEGISASAVAMELLGSLALVITIIYDGYQSNIFQDDSPSARFGQLVTALSNKLALSIVASITVLSGVLLLIQSCILAPDDAFAATLSSRSGVAGDGDVELANRAPADFPDYDPSQFVAGEPAISDEVRQQILLLEIQEAQDRALRDANERRSQRIGGSAESSPAHHHRHHREPHTSSPPSRPAPIGNIEDDFPEYDPRDFEDSAAAVDPLAGDDGSAPWSAPHDHHDHDHHRQRREEVYVAQHGKSRVGGSHAGAEYYDADVADL